MPAMTYSHAVRDGLAEEMRRDPLVWALGEDLSTSTLQTLYKGLTEEFGANRIINTPISENTIMGAGVGAAVAGTRPIAHMGAIDWGICAMEELVNQAAKIRYMFGGQARVPLVVREYIGSRLGLAAQHCGSYEAWFVHIPGLVVVAPATPADGKGLLKSSIRCDDPVVFLEHKELLTEEGDVPDSADHLVPLGKANVLRDGKDITIVTWSKMSRMALEAAQELAKKDGIDAEVIDLRTLWPWDKDLVITSVRKTGRLLVPQEAVLVGGFASEIVCTVSETVGLKTPARRIGAPRIPVPFASILEDQYRVGPVNVANAARSILAAS